MHNRVTDIHMHVVPGVDDGARSLDESCEMLRLAAKEGVENVFATPHGTAFFHTDVRAVFRQLEEAVREREIPVELHLGCELRISAENARRCLRRLKRGAVPTMGDSRCVLSEFTFETEAEEYLYCTGALLREGYVPIVAHFERYPNADLKLARSLREAGALIQINAYSIADERDERIRTRANLLLAERAVDFIGTDAHGTDRRPPVFRSGMEAFRRLYTDAYAELVAAENPRKYLTGR